MKSFGMFLIVVCGAFIGVLFKIKNDNILKKTAVILNMLNDIKAKMKSSLFSTREIFISISENSQYDNLEFVKKCVKYLKDNRDFPSAYKKALDESDFDVPKSIRDMLFLLGNHLGTTDIDGQLSYIKLFENHLKKEHDELSKQNSKMGNMYLSFGLLAGLAVAVLLY